MWFLFRITLSRCTATGYVCLSFTWICRFLLPGTENVSSAYLEYDRFSFEAHRGLLPNLNCNCMGIIYCTSYFVPKCKHMQAFLFFFVFTLLLDFSLSYMFVSRFRETSSLTETYSSDLNSPLFLDLCHFCWCWQWCFHKWQNKSSKSFLYLFSLC